MGERTNGRTTGLRELDILQLYINIQIYATIIFKYKNKYYNLNKYTNTYYKYGYETSCLLVSTPNYADISHKLIN